MTFTLSTNFLRDLAEFSEEDQTVIIANMRRTRQSDYAALKALPPGPMSKVWPADA